MDRNYILLNKFSLVATMSGSKLQRAIDHYRLIDVTILLSVIKSHKNNFFFPLPFISIYNDFKS